MIGKLPFACCLLWCCLPAAASPRALNDHLLEALRRANGVPGMSAAIVKDGQIVWQGHSGHADVSRNMPVTASTRFRLASVSKFVTTVMLARLVEQQRISLEAPITRYFPEYPAKAFPITSLQLATHISGMPHYDAVLDAQRDEVTAPFESVTAGLDVFKERALVHRPGHAYLYSSFGFNLLAAVMERAAQQDYRSILAALAQRAAAPSLTAELMEADRKHWSALYEVGGKELARGNITYNWAGGGLLSTALDLARVGALTLDQSYLSPATLALFQTPVRLSSGAPVAADGFTMGIGWRMNTDQHGRRYFHHSGATRGARSHISVYPDQQLVVTLLSNASWTSAMELTARSLAEHALGQVAEEHCVPGSFTYQGRYKDQPVHGTLRVERSGQHCKAILQADNALGRWLSKGAAGASHVDLLGRGGRMALVTPLGLFPATRSGANLTLTLTGAPVVLTLRQDLAVTPPTIAFARENFTPSRQ